MDLVVRDASPEGDVEVVEHKGVGHPDSICDALAEELSAALSRHYLERFGAILHHNVDKALLCGGAARPAFGGGVVDVPVEITLAGRATRRAFGEDVPVDEIAARVSRAWLRANLHALDADAHVTIVSRVRPGSGDLVDLFARARGDAPPLANDTSIGVGYAPLSPVERAVLAIAAALRARASAAPEVGEDTKVLAVRRGPHVDITVACALVGRHLRDLTEYRDRREAVAKTARAAAEAAAVPARVRVNAADDDRVGSVYLTVTGTSAEAGDDGQVGRGNRWNGLITPLRPMSLEAHAGKNPVTHVGKLYNAAAHALTADIVARVPEVAYAEAVLVSRIGAPVTEPAFVDVRLRRRDGVPARAVEDAVRAVVREHVAGIGRLWRTLLAPDLARALRGASP